MLVGFDVENDACRCILHSLKRGQRGGWKTGQNRITVVQSRKDQSTDKLLRRLKIEPFPDGSDAAQVEKARTSNGLNMGFKGEIGIEKYSKVTDTL